MNSEYIQKYKLNKYNDFLKLIINEEENTFIYQYISSDENINNYDSFTIIIEKYKNEKFQINDLNGLNIKKYGIDIFYFSTSNIILSCLKLKDFDKSLIYICLPLFKNYNRIFIAIQFFYNPEKYRKIKSDYNIDSESLNILLYSYRYYLNELDYNSTNSIYNYLYYRKNIENINKYYYPGNNISNIPIYEIYSKIESHFRTIPIQKCFECLYKNGSYHSIIGGVPNNKYTDLNCKECGEPIGSEKTQYGFKPVKRENYFRIFKNKEELDKETKKRFNLYNYMTIDEFKEKYIEKLFMEEKGIIKIDEDFLKKDDKQIRNLSQVSYRLLNFILYSHLFFAKLYTENKKFDNYLPANMDWMKMLRECWELLKIELNKKDISVIDIFMNYVFFDIFTELNKSVSITDYQSFINLEKNLDEIILKKINDFKTDYKSIDKLKKFDKNDKFFPVNLLEEKYQDYDDSEYPFYNYFYYSDYISEDYLLEIVKHNEKNKYPILKRVLEHNNSSMEKKQYSLDFLNNFNNVLNLFNEKYSLSISRKKAEQIILKDEQLYKENKIPINEFISFYNSLNIQNDKKKVLQLSEENKLSDFFINDNNEIGKSYKNIYNKFIEEQNNEISDLLDIKIEKGIFDKNCKNKINIQNANENDIFLLIYQKKFSLIDSIFNSCYRKIIVNNDYKLYNQFEINMDVIEESMTELLLKNKKLFNNVISNFIYQNEDLSFENIDIITKFNTEYITEEISLSEKVILYQFYTDNIENINLFKSIIKDFIQLIIYLDNYNILLKNAQKNVNFIKENSLIFETFKFLDDKISNDFKLIFKEDEIFTINKTTNLIII